MIPDEKAVPFAASVVHMEVARGDGGAGPLQFGEVVLTGEGGDVSRPNASEGLMKAEKALGGEEVDVFVGAAVKTQNVAAHGGKNFFPIVPMGYKIEVREVGEEGNDINIEEIYFVLHREMIEGSSESVSAQYKFLVCLLVNVCVVDVVAHDHAEVDCFVGEA